MLTSLAALHVRRSRVSSCRRQLQQLTAVANADYLALVYTRRASSSGPRPARAETPVARQRNHGSAPRRGGAAWSRCSASVRAERASAPQRGHGPQLSATWLRATSTATTVPSRRHTWKTGAFVLEAPKRNRSTGAHARCHERRRARIRRRRAVAGRLFRGRAEARVTASPLAL